MPQDGPGLTEEIDVSEAPPGLDIGAPTFTPLGDGSEMIDLAPKAAGLPIAGGETHDANLAEFMPETALQSLAEQLINAVENDLKSRADWENMMAEGIKYLGWKFEDRNWPFPGASGVFDTVMEEAAIRWYSTASSELLPASGPVKTQIVGIPSEETDAQSSRVKEFMNYYLMEGAPEYVEETNQMLLWLSIVGSAFKKTYQDPILNRPVSPFISANDVIVNFGAADVDTAPRVTHRFGLPLRDMKMRQLSGFYRDTDLGVPNDTVQQSGENPIQQQVNTVQGVQRTTSSDPEIDIEYKMFEVHCDLDLEGFEHRSSGTSPDIPEGGGGEPTGLPLPYIVTIETDSRRVMAIRRNWNEGDKSYQKIGYFTHFKFMPGLGFYGLGYAHILGNPAKSATALQRQMIDAATLEMFPGGLRVKGMRLDNNNKMIAPCEFVEIDTGGLPISQAVSPMPYKGPSQWSFELWKEGRANATKLGMGSEIAVGEGRQDAPVGTTIALLEAANRPQSATIKNCHRAFRREFKLIAALFGQFLPETPYPFPVAGGQQTIMRADFTNNVDVIPVSDPNINSSAQRQMRAEVIWRSAMEAPQIHDLREAAKQRYIEMAIDPARIDAILPPEQKAEPLDPLTENQNALMGKPLVAAAYQDHQAHIMAHQPLAETVPTIQAHIAEHMALAMRVNVEKMLGITLPPPGTKLPPDVENQLAVMVAQALQQLDQPQGEQPTPEQIAMEQIKVEGQKVAATLHATQARTQVEAFKAKLRYAEAEKDRQADERIALINAQAKRAERAKANAQRFSQRREF